MDPLEQLTREVGRTIGDGPGPERRQRQRRAALRLTRAPQRHGFWSRWAAPLAVAAALVLVWVVREAPRPATLTAQVGARPFAAGAWLAADEQPVALEFSDRSRVVLAPAAAIRLIRVDAAGVELGLERGRLDLEVVADEARAWRVAAGPFTIAVTGTRFSAEWRPDSQTLAVAVAEGRVQVHGGTLPAEGSRLSAQQRLEVRAVPETEEVASVAEPEPARVEPVREPVRSRPAREVPAWRRLSDAGEHAAALAAIEREGLAGQLGRLGADDLDRLAHSARLAGAAGPAREALTALRRRFPGDARAHKAAFLLGRVALDLANDPGDAAAWFTTYLEQRADAPLAEEARGRLLQIWRDLGDADRVRAAARDYLAHHPEGSRAGQARAMLATP